MDDNMSNPSSSSTTTAIITTKKKRNKGVRLSTDPQSIAARERRHRISDRFKILQSLVPGGTKMDTVSMLEEAIHYVKFLKTQIWLHETMMNFIDDYDHDLDDPSPPSDHHFFTDPPPSTTNLDYLSSALPPPCGFQGDDAKPILPNVSKNYFP